MFLQKSVHPIVPSVIYPWHSANFWHCCFSLKARTRKPSFKLWLQSRKDTYLVLSLEWQQLWHFMYHKKCTRYCLDLVVGSFPFDQAQIQYPWPFHNIIFNWNVTLYKTRLEVNPNVCWVKNLLKVSWARNRQAKNHRARNHRAIGQEKADGKLELNKLILYLAKQKKLYNRNYFSAHIGFT